VDDGAAFRLAEPDERALREFARLHHARWADRGGSGVLTPGVERMLGDVARELAPSGRFRLHTIEAAGETISSHLVLAAGGTASYWLGGFDDAWSRRRPAVQSLVHAIEHAFTAGDRFFDLGAGGQDYKYRLANTERVLRTTLLVRGGLRARASLAPRVVRQEVVTRLPAGARSRLRRARESLRGPARPA
jgi:CelD/BcsL family acetyltransferase involved in cellulose biosynthesis